MRLGYVIVYVPDVPAAASFYERAFGLRPGRAAESGTYAEMETGETKLAFASLALARGNVPGGVRPGFAGQLPAHIEIALTADDVEAAYHRAVAAGAAGVAEPVEKPWGQTVAYVRDHVGTLIELCSPVAPEQG